jgi:orotidine-5'-phosphate decarboxylase
MTNKKNARERLIIALDYASSVPAMRMAQALRGLAATLKVGSILFTACGPSIVRRIRALGFGVMLDLKFFDIPSTVELSARAATSLGVSLLTVHAAGGKMMLQAAVKGARDQARRDKRKPPRVLAVTVLTSTDAGGGSLVVRKVLGLAALAAESGCDGVVASAQEATLLRKRFGQRLSVACPGIRPCSSDAQDQRRVTTPSQALAAGADWLVVGRPITAARDPRAAAQQILKEMEVGRVC